MLSDKWAELVTGLMSAVPKGRRPLLVFMGSASLHHGSPVCVSHHPASPWQQVHPSPVWPSQLVLGSWWTRSATGPAPQLNDFQ